MLARNHDLIASGENLRRATVGNKQCGEGLAERSLLGVTPLPKTCVLVFVASHSATFPSLFTDRYMLFIVRPHTGGGQRRTTVW